jgi:hypothetical protein
MDSTIANRVMDDAENAVEEGRADPPAWVVMAGGEKLWRRARADESLRRELVAMRLGGG